MNFNLVKALTFICIPIALQGCAHWKDIFISEYKYPLYGGEWVGGKAICNAKRCKAGTDGASFSFTTKPWSPPTKTETTPKSAVMHLVGRVTDNSLGGTPYYCDINGKKSPFNENDIAPLALADGKGFEYSRSETLKLDVNAAVESDLASLQAANVLPADIKIAELKANLTAAYSSLDSSNIVINGKYMEFGLTPEAFLDLFQTKKHSDCLKVIKDEKTNYRVITGVGIVWFDLEYDSSSATKLISDLKTEFSTKGIDFDIGASIKRTVNESLTSMSKNGFQVITWTLADSSYEWKL